MLKRGYETQQVRQSIFPRCQTRNQRGHNLIYLNLGNTIPDAETNFALIREMPSLMQQSMVAQQLKQYMDLPHFPIPTRP